VTVANSVSLAALAEDPHAVHHQLRAQGPVVWVPAIGGWIVTGRKVAVDVMRDSETFTVDDPRFSTAQVVGPSMLSKDGAAHQRHRSPFVEHFTARRVDHDLASWVESEANRLVVGLSGSGAAELRSTLAAPLAVATIVRSLGLIDVEADKLLGWYTAIVEAVEYIAADAQTRSAKPAGTSRLPAEEGPTAGHSAGTSDTVDSAAGYSSSLCPASGDKASTGGVKRGHHGAAHAFAELSSAVKRTIAAGAPLLSGVAGRDLTDDEIVSNAAVIMFGAIETSEGATASALLHLLADPSALRAVRDDRSLLANAVEESFRLEPAAASVDRYATRNVRVGGATIATGDYVSVALAAANRDPAVFTNPDTFDIHRHNVRQHTTFAYGPHACLGIHLARIETIAAINAVLTRLRDVELDSERTKGPRGLVFRKPVAVHANWNTNPT